MKHASLFSGIGGFDLAAMWAGWNNVFMVEIDKFCQSRLIKNFPEVKLYEDIKQFNGIPYKNKIDVISAGFPCQPYSVAGKQKGQTDDRNLWPETIRIIREIKPTFFIGENVPGIIKLALDTVLLDLENEGYTCETFIIPAASKGAWHKRDRIWIIAYTNSSTNLRNSRKDAHPSNFKKIQERHKMEFTDESNNLRKSNIFCNTNNAGCKKQRFSITAKKEFFTPKCPSWWQVEPKLDRVADGVPNRMDRLKALGNAVCPQIPYEIFKAINKLTITDH